MLGGFKTLVSPKAVKLFKINDGGWIRGRFRLWIRSRILTIPVPKDNMTFVIDVVFYALSLSSVSILCNLKIWLNPRALSQLFSPVRAAALKESSFIILKMDTR
jgi:hypothetical protein